MDKYFDVFVYVANWGSNQLMIRIPRRFLDVELASRYADDEALTIRPRKDHTLLEFRLQDDEPPDEWVEGEAWMPRLVPLWTDLMGDYRALYLGWLAGIPMREEEGEDEEEPPVPPGLAKLSAPLAAPAHFLAIDEDLIEAAARGKPRRASGSADTRGMARWVKRMPAADKDDILVRFLNDEGDLCSGPSSERFRGYHRAKDQPRQRPGAGRSANCSRQGMCRPRRNAGRRRSRGPGKGRERPKGCRASGEATRLPVQATTRDLEVRRGADRPQDGDEL